MKTVIIIIVAVVVSLGLATGLVVKQLGKSSEIGTPVRLEPVVRGELVEIVSAPGIVQPKTKVSISARVAARIVELPFKEGDAVKKNESVLVKLDAKDLEAQLRAEEARSAAQAANIEMARSTLDSRQADIRALRAELAEAQRDMQRQTELLESEDVSRSSFDQAQMKFDQLKARIDAADHSVAASRKNLTVMEHQLEAAQAEILRATDNLSYTTIISPIDGVVTKLNAEVGELVVMGTMNNQGTVIMEVADLATMLVRARVDETAIADVEANQKAVVRIQAYDEEGLFNGVVQTVGLAVTEEKDGSKFYKTEILLDTKGRRVLSGLNADVDIETRRHAGVLRVPSQAVLGRKVDDLPVEIRDKAEVDKEKALCPVVFRFVDGKAVVTPVTVGPSDLTHTAIASGLSENDVIITGPYKVFETMAHDQKVKDERQATTKPADDAAIAKSNGRRRIRPMIIRLRNITKVYRVGVERIHAVAGVSLDVAENEYVALMGTSGSGKSTLMNILGCLDRPTSGTYELDGRLTTRMGAAALARVRNERIGFVFQSFELMPRLSALKNVELPLIYSKTGWWKRRQNSREALDRVGLSDRVRHRPNQLSGGQKQRVAIARALVNRPAMLLADEPTGNLDSRTSDEILSLFDELYRNGQTIIMVTHEADVARHARRIIRMRDGKIVSDLPAEKDQLHFTAAVPLATEAAAEVPA